MKDWEISMGFYPGILLGVRSYPSDRSILHVVYLPFIDIALEIWDIEDEDE
jgi:hypothetical protein